MIPNVLRSVAAHGPRSKLKAMMAADGIVRAPGIVDPIAARLVEAAGFEAIYMTGGGLSRSIGFPDIGLLTMTEIVDRLRLIVRATDLPVIADADTGYGNALNLVRAVAEFEEAGAAAIHIEDQVTPKKCGHYSGKELISIGEMTKKLDAALAARRDPEMLIIARTDARAVEGMDGVCKRALAYARIGVDAIFFEAPESLAEIKQLREHSELPLLINAFAGGKTPPIKVGELAAFGIKIVIFPSQLQRIALRAMQFGLDILKTGDVAGAEIEKLSISFKDRDLLIGLGEISQLETRYLREDS
jgi:2-methylisocitrate lyase-like PEP mutase family enzyme